MKLLMIVALIAGLLACSSEQKEDENLIADIDFVDKSVESCIKARAEIEGFTKTEELTEVLCKGGDGYSSFEDLNHFPNLDGIALHSLEVGELDFDNIHYLEELIIVSSELLTSISLNNLPKLKLLDLRNSHKVAELNLNSLPELEVLSIRDSVLATLNLGDIQSLKSLSIGTFGTDAFLFGLYPSIEHLDLTANQNLEEIEITYTKLTSVMLEGLESLSKLTIYSSQLEQIDLINHPNLKEIMLFDNRLSRIDLDGMPELVNLQLSTNSLESIKLDLNEKLNTVDLRENPLSPKTIEYLDSVDWIEDLRY